MPQRALSALTARSAESFNRLLDETGVTICGLNPLRVLLQLCKDDWQAQVLAYTTSGALTGDWEHSVSYASLAKMLNSGAEVRTTRLSETFDYDDFVRRHWKRAVPLFALTPKGRLRVFVAGEELEPGPGWRLVALVQPSGTPREQENAEGASAAERADAGGAGLSRG